MSKKQKLTDNKELMEVMSAAGEEDYSEAAKRIEEMEKNADPDADKNPADGDAPKLTEAQSELKRYEDEYDGVEVEYDLDENELEEALKLFQKKTIYKKNIVYTALLGAISVCFGVVAVLETSNLINYIIALGCLFIIFLLWYLPFRHISAVKASSGAVKETFYAYVFSDCLFASSAQGGITQVRFNSKSFAVESKSGLIIGVDRERLFLLPYRCMTDDDKVSLRELLKPAFEERYEIKNEVSE